MRNLILASSSVERKEILKKVVSGTKFENFTIIPPNIDESVLDNENARTYVKRIAITKAETIFNTYNNDIIIAADTIVYAGKRILRKAESIEEALKQITFLSGRSHRVYTGICVISPFGISIRVLFTRIIMKKLSVTEINQFIESNEWQNVAVYKISGIAGRLIKSINGLETTVRGLSLFDATQMLSFHISHIK